MKSFRVPCPHCKGFVEHIILDGEDDGLVEHKCISCTRTLEKGFQCSELCLIDQIQRKRRV